MIKYRYIDIHICIILYYTDLYFVSSLKYTLAVKSLLFSEYISTKWTPHDRNQGAAKTNSVTI